MQSPFLPPQLPTQGGGQQPTFAQIMSAQQQAYAGYNPQGQYMVPSYQPGLVQTTAPGYFQVPQG